MTRGKLIARLFVAAGVAVAAGTQAQAGLLPNSVTVTPEAGNYRWSYALVLPTDMKLQSGNYFTIYDFNGYQPGGETAPAGANGEMLWEFSAAKTGPTPGQLNPKDDAELYNLTWKYVGPTIPSGQEGLGNFWAFSSIQVQAEKADNFAAVTNRTSDGQPDNNVTNAITPGPNNVTPTPTPPGVPEPATLILAGLGLPAAGLLRGLRKKK